MTIFKIRFDDEGDPATPPATPPATSPPGKTFTQDEVNAIMAKEKRAAEAKRNELINELNTLKESSQLTAEEKANLEARIEQLSTEGQTKEQLAKRERDKLEKKYQSDLETKSKEAETWKTRYTAKQIERDLMDAASKAEALVPSQIVDMLRAKTRLVEELDGEGKPTGDYITTVDFVGEENGKPVKLSLSVSDALTRMKEMSDYGNLFKSSAAGGTGTTSGAGNKKGKLNLRDPKVYAQWRKENPGLELTADLLG